jgi:hypothetical protein
MGVGEIGAAIGAGGKLFSGYEQNKALREQAKQTRYEAEEMAKLARQEAENVQEKQKMRFIKSGIEIAPGTALLTLADTKAKGEKTASRILERGYKQSKQLKRSGRNAIISSLLGATSTGLTAYGGYSG